MNIAPRPAQNNNFQSRESVAAMLRNVDHAAVETGRNAGHGNVQPPRANHVRVEINNRPDLSNDSELFELSRQNRRAAMPDGGPQVATRGRGLMNAIHEDSDARNNGHGNAERPRRRLFNCPSPSSCLPSLPACGSLSQSTRSYICSAVSVVGFSAVGLGVYLGYSLLQKKLAADGTVG